MSPEICVPAESDREQIAHVLSTSLNLSLERALARAPTFPLQDFRCVYDGDRIVTTAAELHFLQWFGGRSMPMSGIFGVATLPEHRRSGLATAAVRRILEEARERGDPVSALYPAILRPYRSIGYEVAGSYVEHRLAIDAIPEFPREDLLEVEVVDLERDLEGIKGCYHAWARGSTGAIEPTDDAWWTRRVFDWPFDQSFRAVVVRGEGGVEGFASAVREATPGPLDIAFGLACNTFVATTPAALRSLLAYFRGHQGVARWMEWVGPPSDPVSLLVDEQTVELHSRYLWMLRVLDVRAAFEQRGYPAEDGACTIAVHDPLFRANAGPWRIEASDGEVSVEQTTDRPERTIPIGALSAMFSGYLRPRDAARLGYLDPADPAVEVLARLLAGPEPWCPFFF